MAFDSVQLQASLIERILREIATAYYDKVQMVSYKHVLQNIISYYHKIAFIPCCVLN